MMMMNLRMNMVYSMCGSLQVMNQNETSAVASVGAQAEPIGLAGLASIPEMLEHLKQEDTSERANVVLLEQPAIILFLGKTRPGQ